MPCRYEETEYDREQSARRKELDLVTRLLCGVCKHAEAMGRAVGGADFELEVQAWWARHKVIDAKREAREEAHRNQEAAIVAAREKFTAEERKLLGIR